MKTVFALLSFGLTAGLIFGLCGCGKKAQKVVKERETRVMVEPLKKRIFREQIPVQGTVEPVEFATISAKISGTVELLKVDEGDVVKKGATLFGIDRKILKNQVTVREDDIKVKNAELEVARIARETAEITRKKAQADYDRAQRLWKSRAISQTEFENYEIAYQKAMLEVSGKDAAVNNALAQLKQAESNLMIAKKNLADSVIIAPFDCIVTDSYIEENEYVSSGQKLLKLENHSRLEVVCYISSVYYNRIKTGETTVEFLADNGSSVRGKVTYKAPSIDPESRVFKLKALVPEKIKLVSGMLCNINLILREKEGYGLPADAPMLRANNRYIVYAVGENNRAKSFDVKKGIVDGKYCEILNADKLMKETFVVTGQSFVNNGSLLKIINK